MSQERSKEDILSEASLSGYSKFSKLYGDHNDSDSNVDFDESREGLVSHTEKKTSKQSSGLPWKVLLGIICTLVVTVLAQSFYLAHLRKELSHQLPKVSPYGLSYARDQIRFAHIPTRFFNENTKENEKAWTDIDSGHGLVSVTPEWAQLQGLPDTLAHPKDSSKRIYVIEAYHAIHCLQNLRRHYMSLLHHEKPDRPLEHDLHCFDSLRQSIMCQANDELMYTTGHHDVGVNQTRQCRSWDALRDWASERTACYHDYEAPEGESRWGKCDNGDDGLPVGSLLS